MSEFITRTARLVPYAKRPKQVPSFVTAYSHEPLPDEPAANMGSLFVVIEVLVSGRSSEEVADLIIETLGDRYYNYGQNEAEPLARFEAAIKATNHELGEYVSQGNAAWIGKLSAVAAIQVGDELHVVQTGSAEAFLYRGKAATRIAGGSSSRPSVPTKTFSAIASGQLEVGDRLLLVTPALIHQLSLAKLQQVIAHASPNNAIAELTTLLQGGTNERVAALVVEVTTPELAAMQMRSEEPSEIHLGSPETPLEAAKMAAAPVATAALKSGKRVHQLAKQGWQTGQPHLHQGTLSVVKFLRRLLAGSHGRRNIILILVTIIMLGGASWWWQARNTATDTLLNRYQATYQQYLLADQAADDGDQAGARELLNQLQRELSDLAKTKGHSQLDAKLKKIALLEGQPNTIAAMAALVATRLDELDGLRRINATTVADFGDLGGAKLTNVEVAGGKAYVLTNQNQISLHIITLAGGAKRTSTANFKALGQVKATTVAATGDGLFLLTNKPSVWFYRFDTDSLTEQTINQGQWPAAQAIASYATSLYLLGTTAIYKHSRAGNGYTPKVEYLTQRQTDGIKDASGLAVDGLVYLLSPTGLRQYLAGTLQRTATLPTSLTTAKSLRSTNDGQTLIATSPNNQRIAIWKVTTSGISLTGQYQINGSQGLSDALYDTKTKVGYALVDNKLVKFTP